MLETAAPSREEIAAALRHAGSANADFFGFPCFENGLFLQQDPEEYTSFVHFMATRVPPVDLTLDIGVASGGQTKFLRDFFHARQTIVVDNGLHAQFPHWQRIKPLVNSEIILELIKDSHGKDVKQALASYAGRVDVAFVDGDHSYRGLRKDIFLVLPLLRIGGIMILHDTAAVGPVNRVFRELLYSKHFVLLQNFQSRFGISLWRVTRHPRPLSSAFGFATGYGRL